MAKIIAFTNQKGGVGKTTCCINLASCVAEKGKKVLLIDLDPQSNTTSGLGLSQTDKLSIYDVLTKDAPIDDNCICATAVKGLDCITSSVSLAGAELELASVFGRESILKIALQPILDRYDFIFIDCPPSLGTYRQRIDGMQQYHHTYAMRVLRPRRIVTTYTHYTRSKEVSQSDYYYRRYYTNHVRQA